MADSDYKSSHAYQLLKECIKEVYSQYNGDDVDSVSNLNKCRDTVNDIINGTASTMSDIKKNDKLSKAHEVVSQATKSMQDNVRNMINNQKDVTVSARTHIHKHIHLYTIIHADITNYFNMYILLL